MRNSIRKALSVVSASLLGASALVAAAPAYAAGEVKLEADSGSGYSIVHGEDFGLKTSITAGNDTAELQYLHYTVTTGGGVNVYVLQDDIVTAADANDTLLVSSGESKDTIAYADYTAGEVAAYLSLWITEAADDSTFEATDSDVSVTVTAFIDKDGDDVADSDEWQSSQVVKWVDNANYDFVNVLTQPAVNDTKLAGTVTSATINLDQSKGSLNIDYSTTSTSAILDPTGGASTEDDDSLTYDSDDNELDYESAGNGSEKILVAGGVFKAQLQVAIGGTSTDIAASSRTVGTTTTNNIDVAIAAGANNTAMASAAMKVRSGAGSFTVKGTVEDSSNAAIKDKVVTITVAEDVANDWNSAATFTVGGKSVTNASSTKVEKVTATTTSAADGTFSFVVSYSGVKDTEVADITLSVDGITDLQTATNGALADVIAVTAEDTAATTLYSADVIATDEELVFATGAAFELNYHVMDQFSQLYTASGLNVVVTHNSDTYSAAVVGGKATVSFGGFDADNDGKLSMSADVTAPGADPTVSAVVTEVFVGTNKAVSTLTLAGTYGTSTSKTTLNTNDTASADVRFGQGPTAPSNEIDDAQVTLRDADGNTTRGQVTFSGTNLMFEGGTSIVFSSGSITVWTDENGVADVDISSQYSGTHTLTVTAGGVSTTKDIVFDAAAATAGTSLTVTVADYVAPGATASVVATLTDKFGNPVKVTDTADFKLTYAGPGLPYPSTLPTTTDASGQAKFSVLLGSQDSGSGVITAQYDQSSDGDFTGTVKGDLDLTTTASFAVGTAPATQKVNAGSFKGYVAVYARGYEGQRLSAKVGKDWVIVDPIVNNQENGSLFRVVEFTGAGVDIAVRIYIDRVLVDTIALTTK